MTERRYKSFAEFYPFYLSEHGTTACRRLHFIGSALTIVLLLFSIITTKWLMLLLLPVIGYGFAWAGHFFFEKNRPATFTYPLYSFLGDWMMFKNIIQGKIKF